MKKDKKAWNPYMAGALSGVVLILSVWIAGQFFGASTTFARTAGALEKIFAPDRAAGIDYFIKYAPKIDWQALFVIGIFIGALIASKMSGSFVLKAVPDMWKRRFGTSVIKRGTVAFFGGLIAMFGARLADG